MFNYESAPADHKALGTRLCVYSILRYMYTIGIQNYYSVWVISASDVNDEWKINTCKENLKYSMHVWVYTLIELRCFVYYRGTFYCCLVILYDGPRPLKSTGRHGAF